MIKKEIGNLLSILREKTPLVHQITNYVTANDCANVTLAIGASPVMADGVEEVEQMVSIASALVLNIGTLNESSIKASILAGKKANELGVPVILDPVGAGATKYRTESIKKILNNVKLSVIRGNLSEIKTLYGIETSTKGVDSQEKINEKEDINIAKNFSKKTGAIIAITGKTDIITNGEKTYLVENGYSIMSKVTGTGCMCTAVIGSFLGATSNNLLAALAGVVSMGLSGEIANESLKENEGTGTLRVKIVDNLYNLNSSIVEKRGKIYEK